MLKITRQLMKRTNLLADFKGRNAQVLAALVELSEVLPKDTFVGDLIFKEGVFEINGLSGQAAALPQIIDNSPLFKDVEFVSAITRSAIDRRAAHPLPQTSPTVSPSASTARSTAGACVRTAPCTAARVWAASWRRRFLVRPKAIGVAYRRMVIALRSRRQFLATGTSLYRDGARPPTRERRNRALYRFRRPRAMGSRILGARARESPRACGAQRQDARRAPCIRTLTEGTPPRA